MPSRRVVLFNGESPLYLTGFRDSDTHIRGFVENGAYNIILKKGPPIDFMWTVHEETALHRCDFENEIGTADPTKISWIEVPDTVMGDYNVIINWAKTRREELNASDTVD
jgi:hypothetical protein